jgi:hypothetical protein
MQSVGDFQREAHARVVQQRGDLSAHSMSPVDWMVLDHLEMKHNSPESISIFESKLGQ